MKRNTHGWLWAAVCIALTATFSIGCGGGDAVVKNQPAPSGYQIALYPFNEDLAAAIKEYAAPLEVTVVADADYSASNFLGYVKWETQQERVFGRPYVYKKQEEQSSSDHSWKLSNLFGALPFTGDSGSSTTYEIQSSIMFSDYRTYELPTILTYSGEETAETFSRMIAKSAIWTQEGERRAILQLNNAKRIRALEDLQDRIARVEG
ncbi:MAG: hypothetical protein GC154_04135 [bacterium]|nr:hypothetical protein [bacterium]